MYGHSVHFTCQKYIQTQPSIRSRSRIFNLLLENLYWSKTSCVWRSALTCFLAYLLSIWISARNLTCPGNSFASIGLGKCVSLGASSASSVILMQTFFFWKLKNTQRIKEIRKKIRIQVFSRFSFVTLVRIMLIDGFKVFSSFSFLEMFENRLVTANTYI